MFRPGNMPVIGFKLSDSPIGCPARCLGAVACTGARLQRSLPLEGRGIAYGDSGVASATWRRVAEAGRSSAVESDREQTRIETRTAVGTFDKLSLAMAYRACILSICDSPALEGEGQGRGNGQLRVRGHPPPRPSPHKGGGSTSQCLPYVAPLSYCRLKAEVAWPGQPRACLETRSAPGAGSPPFRRR
jgi:hypothetical protein